MAYELMTPALAAGADVPRNHACEGEDVSPPFGWVDAPDAVADER